MGFEVRIALAVIISVLIVVAAHRKHPPSDASKKPEADGAPLRPTPQPRPIPKSVEGPFDATRAKEDVTTQVLTGRAWVTDGDTITIKKTQIRLFGIDAPELNHPYGKKSKWVLHGLCKGREVRAEVCAEDHYGRVVAKCYLSDGRDLSAEMVKLGMAIDWPKFSGGRYTGLEPEGIRKKLWLADARQKGRMHVWERFEARQAKPP